MIYSRSDFESMANNEEEKLLIRALKGMSSSPLKDKLEQADLDVTTRLLIANLALTLSPAVSDDLIQLLKEFNQANQASRQRFKEKVQKLKDTYRQRSRDLWQGALEDLKKLEQKVTAMEK